MIRLKDILKETEEYQQLPSELKKHFLEIISTYGQHREAMTRKSDIRTISETLGAIADAAQEYTLREGGDWFDRVTIKRNMNELKKLQAAFDKEAQEAAAQQQRLESLYEDMGHTLGRYFEIADVSEDVMKQRLGLQQTAQPQNQQRQQIREDAGCKSCQEQESKVKLKEERVKGVKYIDELGVKFTPDELKILALILNSYQGSGPHITPKTATQYGVKYAVKYLAKAKQDAGDHTNKKDIATLNSLIKKIK